MSQRFLAWTAAVILAAAWALPAHAETVDPEPLKPIEPPSSLPRAQRGDKTQNLDRLFAALKVASGEVIGQTTESKKRTDFRAFMDSVLAELPATKEVQVILDNLSTHKKNDDWLAPRVIFTDPGFAAVGLNEAAARARYGEVRVLRLPFAANASFTEVKGCGAFLPPSWKQTSWKSARANSNPI